LVAAWNSANRPAAMTAIAVQKLARADSVSIGFIGCGVQARSHFDVLRLVLPDLKEVVACSRSAASAERFVAMVRSAGLVARTTLEPREAIEGLDVIITTVPEGAQVLEFLDTAWVTPGAFVGAVDLARSWKPGTLRAMDILATDEREQTRVLTASGRMNVRYRERRPAAQGRKRSFSLDVRIINSR
jgi:alanine dehydrogenase